MKSLKIHSLLGICLLFTATACSQDDGPPPPPKSVTYEACCGADPVEFTQDSAHVFVPNVFTPNGDGINDLFYPVINDEVAEVANFLIYTPDSEATDTLIFDRQTIVYSQLENYAWNGLRYDGTPFNGRPFVGPFKYSMVVILKSGGAIMVEGRACRIECGEEAAVFQDREGCFYPSQASPEATLDAGLPTNEKDCFK